MPTPRPVLMDALLAAVMTGLAVDSVIWASGGAADWRLYLLAVLTAAPIAVRQLAPVTTLAIIMGAQMVYGLLDREYTANVPVGGLGILIAIFTVATLRSRRVAALVCLPTMALIIVYLLTRVQANWADVVQVTLVLLGPWMLGDGTRRWAQRAERLAAQAAQAVAEERVRIARELHDIVAHHMSVVSLQTGVAQYVLDTDLPTARQAIAAAGSASREGLTEMRRLLDVLRVDPAADSADGSDHDQGVEYSPQPGLEMIEGLVDRTRSAGVPVDLVVTGRQRPLPPGPDLCAYRVAQEALTNVLKHAGQASVQVRLDYGERTFTLTVRDDGAGQKQPVEGSPASHGIRGMQERAELYGGVLTAGPLPERGFAVVLRLPMGADGLDPDGSDPDRPGADRLDADRLDADR